MRTTIDSAGRLVIPESLREEAGIEPGMELDVRYCDGRIEVEPVSTMRLEERDGFLVAVPSGPVPAFTNEMVTRLIEELREERGAVYPGDDSG